VQQYGGQKLLRVQVVVEWGQGQFSIAILKVPYHMQENRSPLQNHILTIVITTVLLFEGKELDSKQCVRCGKVVLKIVKRTTANRSKICYATRVKVA
jgi:recombinational DNA repair protein (RecF pathway)